MSERLPSSDITPDQEPPIEIYEPILSQKVTKSSIIDYVPEDSLPIVHEELKKLAGVQRTKEIGRNGPLNAAGTSERNKHLEAFGLYLEFYLRDAFVAGDLLQKVFPEITESTILASLPYNGTVDNLDNTEWIDEQESGKSPHQVRPADHPRSIAQYERRKRGYPYYGAIDTTGKNMLAISRVSLDDLPHSLSFLDKRYTDQQGNNHSVGEGFMANTQWLLRHLSFNPEGLNESIQINPLHHANQSWADSPDSFHHADGTLARHHPERNWGVASVEVNAETYDALRAAIRTYQAWLPHVDASRQQVLEATITELEMKVATLHDSILREFWVEDDNFYGGYFARGTDRDENGNLHPLEIRSSDMGHVLDSEVLEDGDPKVESIILNLFSPEMLAPNGIRTLSSDSVRYHKHAYHNGSVWPWDTMKIARGLKKHGYYGLAHELENRIMRFYEQTNTLAEYGSGGDDIINMTQKVSVFDPALHPEAIEQYSQYDIIQPPQDPQLWTVAALTAIKYENGDRALGREASPIKAIDPAKRAFELSILHNL